MSLGIFLVGLKLGLIHFESDIHRIIAVQIILLKGNKVYVGKIEMWRLIEWLKVKSINSLLFEKVILVILNFSTTWLVEMGFSATNDVLTKKSNLWQRGEKRIITGEAEPRLGSSTWQTDR